MNLETDGTDDRFDRNEEPIEDTPVKCDVCGVLGTDHTPDEGDTWWCRTCMLKWEQQNQQHWEDGSPL